jgi:hypothetical protein
MTIYLTAEYIRKVYGATNVNTLFTTSSVGKAIDMKSWVVLEVFEALNKLNVMHKDGWNERTKSHYWKRTRDFLQDEGDVVLVGVTLGFDDFDRLNIFSQMPELILQQAIANLIAENRLTAFYEGNREYLNYAVVPPLVSLLPQKVPTNLIKRTVYKDGKPVHTEHYNRNLAFEFAHAS